VGTAAVAHGVEDAVETQDIAAVADGLSHVVLAQGNGRVVGGVQHAVADGVELGRVPGAVDEDAVPGDIVDVIVDDEVVVAADGDAGAHPVVGTGEGDVVVVGGASIAAQDDAVAAAVRDVVAGDADGGAGVAEEQ